MKKMGRYCKAYLLEYLRAYPAWTEKAENARNTDADGHELTHPRVLVDESIVYLQENYVVTDDIYLEDNVLFGDVTPEWVRYCNQILGFSIPDDVAAISDYIDAE